MSLSVILKHYSYYFKFFRVNFTFFIHCFAIKKFSSLLPDWATLYTFMFIISCVFMCLSLFSVLWDESHLPLSLSLVVHLSLSITLFFFLYTSLSLYCITENISYTYFSPSSYTSWSCSFFFLSESWKDIFLFWRCTWWSHYSPWEKESVCMDGWCVKMMMKESVHVYKI